MTNLERDKLVASLRDWFEGRGLAGGEAIGIMVLAITAITREFDDPKVLVDAAIRGLRVAADTTRASH
jgi:hypothetical protein